MSIVARHHNLATTKMRHFFSEANPHSTLESGRLIQQELLEFYFEQMDESTRHRAMKTLTWLRDPRRPRLNTNLEIVSR